MDGSDPVDISGDEPGTFIKIEYQCDNSEIWPDASLRHSILRYIRSSILAAYDVG